MKTLITVTNNTTSLKRHLDLFAIQVNSLEEVLSSRKRDGIFYMEDKIIDEDMNSVVVINLFIGEERFDEKGIPVKKNYSHTNEMLK